MPEYGKLITIYIAGTTGIWKGIPAGIALNVNPLYTGFLTGIGSVSSVLILYFAGNNFRNWFLKHYGKKRIERQKGKFIRIANKYGSWGLGLITPGMLGPFTSLFLGLLLLEDTRKFLYYLIAGLMLWSLILAYTFTPLVNFIAQFAKSVISAF